MIQRAVRSKTFQSIIGIGISAILLIWIFSTIDLQQTWEYMVEANYWPIIPALGLLIVHFLLRAWRWKYLLPSHHIVTFRSLFDALMIGTLANFLLPLRAGEFVRPYALQKMTQVPFVTGFTSLITERFFDLAFVLATFMLVVATLPGIPDWVYSGVWVFGGISVLTLLVILTCCFLPALVRKINSWFASLLPESLRAREQRLFGDFMHSLIVLRNPRNSAMVLLLSAAVWISNFALFYVFLFMFDLPISFSLAVTTAVIVALAVAAPSAPGFLGVYQTACLVAFALFSLDREVAIAYSVVTHLLQYILFIAYGFFALSRLGLRLSQLQTLPEDEPLKKSSPVPVD